MKSLVYTTDLYHLRGTCLYHTITVGRCDSIRSSVREYRPTIDLRIVVANLRVDGRTRSQRKRTDRPALEES
jgi:hypothetical protein